MILDGEVYCDGECDAPRCPKCGKKLKRKMTRVFEQLPSVMCCGPYEIQEHLDVCR